MASLPLLSRRPRAAFTILELLVAAGVTVLLVALMLQVTVNSLDAWNRSSGTLTANNQAQLALKYLADDLSSITWRRDNNVWLLATVQDDQTTDAGDSATVDAEWVADAASGGTGNSKPGRNSASGPSLNLTPASRELTDYRFGQAGMWLRFFTNQPDSNNPANLETTSAPVAVGYQIVRMKVQPNSEEVRYMLFRSVVRPVQNGGTRSTFGAGYDLASAAATGYNSPNAARNNDDNDPDRIRRPRRTDVLANNVVDFGVRFWRRESNKTLTLLFPSDGSGNPSNANLGYAATLRDDTNLVDGNPSSNLSDWISTAVMRYGYPDIADVFIRVLTEDGARKLEAFERQQTVRPPQFANDDEYWWQLVTENSQVYVRRVELRPAAL